MKDTSGMRLHLSRTAVKVAVKNGWGESEIRDCFEHPKKVYPSKTRDGQFRVVNKDICIVGVPDKNDPNVFHGITMFPNGSQAPTKG